MTRPGCVDRSLTKRGKKEKKKKRKKKVLQTNEEVENHSLGGLADVGTAPRSRKKKKRGKLKALILVTNACAREAPEWEGLSGSKRLQKRTDLKSTPPLLRLEVYEKNRDQ